MSEPVHRSHPVQYVRVSTPVLAGLVVEWNEIRQQVQDQRDPLAVADALMQYADVCIAYARRRCLADDRPSAAVVDAEAYLFDDPLSEDEQARVRKEVVRATYQSLRTTALLRKIGRL